MHNTRILPAIMALVLSVLHATTACAADMSAEGSADVQTTTIALAYGQPVFIRQESLVLELIGVTDSRCPPTVACVWTGHAAVALRLTKAGHASEAVAIGTRAPPSMNLPYDATYGNYRLSLVSLEPENSIDPKVPLPNYRATVSIRKLQTQPNNSRP